MKHKTKQNSINIYLRSSLPSSFTKTKTTNTFSFLVSLFYFNFQPQKQQQQHYGEYFSVQCKGTFQSKSKHFSHIIPYLMDSIQQSYSQPTKVYTASGIMHHASINKEFRIIGTSKPTKNQHLIEQSKSDKLQEIQKNIRIDRRSWKRLRQYAFYYPLIMTKSLNTLVNVGYITRVMD